MFTFAAVTFCTGDSAYLFRLSKSGADWLAQITIEAVTGSEAKKSEA